MLEGFAISELSELSELSDLSELSELPELPELSIPPTRRTRSRVATLAALVAVTSLFAVLLPASASAATTSRTATHRSVRAAAPDAVKVAAVLRVAASLTGTPYRAAGTTPAGFDCSGFTRYVFATVGVGLVHSSTTQYAQSVKISAADAVPGDLIFFHTSSGHVYHVAIYAGGGRIWHAQKTGIPAGLTPIWGNAWFAGRVL